MIRHTGPSSAARTAEPPEPVIDVRCRWYIGVSGDSSFFIKMFAARLDFQKVLLPPAIKHSKSQFWLMKFRQFAPKVHRSIFTS